MRRIFLSLVLVNAMFFIWCYATTDDLSAKLQEPVVEVMSASMLANDTLRLLEEVGSQHANPVQPFVALASQEEEQIVKDATNKSVDEVNAVNKANIVNEDIAVNASSPTSSSILTTSAKRSEAISADKVCYWAGLFSDDGERAVILKRLTKLKVAATAVDVPGLRHWIYLPPKATKAEAMATVQSLKAEGVDSYIISTGQHRLGISVGFFTQQVLAEEKMKELQHRGWSPVMDTYERAAGERWLSVNKKDLDAVGDSVLSVMLKNKSNLKVLEKKCN